ncbi:MAG: glycine betaine/L-proline ABC transporter ATP-binding protein [Bacilli bacterium]|nr:glycine betaine/L-proline ABC transporter ATP-binding protein [Bacilli bacterium]
MQSKISVRNLSMIFGDKKEVKEAIALVNEGKSSIEIREKTKATVALNDVSFDIYDSELFVIVGLSGSGKSTLIRCLDLLNKPTLGDVVIDDVTINKLSTKELREFRRNKISMVFQSFGLLSHRNVLKNVEYGLEVRNVDKVERRKKALDYIKVVGLDGWEEMKPSQLSGGMKQRVGLARALTSEPEILLMDEPYGALDPLIRREMQNELLSLEDYINKTIVFITHDMNEAFKLGDRIALMKDGKVVQIGTPQEFFDNPANDYVKDFIADVDKSKILKARSIMRKPDYVAKDDMLRTDLKDALEAKEMSFCYVVDKDNYLKGFVLLEDIKKSRASSIEGLIKENEIKVFRNDVLNDVWHHFDNADYYVAVVDTKNKLRGVISNDDIIAALK